MTENFLTKILEKKREDIDRLKIEKPLAKFYEKINGNLPESRNFKKALTSKPVNIIAEIKKASPSKGDLRLDMNIVEYAKMYENAGAVAISVLTEPHFFKGKLDDLIDVRANVKIPVLRKDFVVDAYQIFEAKFAQADAILLIADVLDEKTLFEFLTVCKYLELDALVEVHEEESLVKALNAGAEIIGINNRCLKSFEVNIETSRELAKLIPDDKIVVSESGIFEKEHIKFLNETSKIKTFLIGEAIVKSQNPLEKIKSLQDLS